MAGLKPIQDAAAKIAAEIVNPKEELNSLDNVQQATQFQKQVIESNQR